MVAAKFGVVGEEDPSMEEQKDSLFAHERKRLQGKYTIVSLEIRRICAAGSQMCIMCVFVCVML